MAEVTCTCGAGNNADGHNLSCAIWVARLPNHVKNRKGKHVSGVKPPLNYSRGEAHMRETHKYSGFMPCSEISDHLCCHGGHGKRKRNIATYVRTLNDNGKFDINLVVK